MVIRKKAKDDDILIKKVSFLLEFLNIKYKDISSYILSFVHRSIVNEKPDYTPEHNERLEFLGDAVLELLITKNLFLDFPDKPEGELTDIRSAIVRGTNLAKIAKGLNFQDFLLLGKGEELSGGRDNDYILANTLEAFLGALYLDLGIEEAKIFIDNYIYTSLDEILRNNLTKDYKTMIQEYSQSKFDITPSYQVLSESGPDHDKTFEVGVYLGDKIVGIGFGSSKKKAQEKSALEGYENIISDGFKI